MSRWPLGVFVSIDAGLGVRLDVARELGVTTAHIHAPSRAPRSPEAVRTFRRRLDAAGIEPTVVFAGFEGESYADIPTVSQTVGLVPQDTREERTAEFFDIANFADSLGVKAVGLHLGCVPHGSRSKDFGAMVSLTQQICDRLGSRGQALHLETGQERAEVLLEFLNRVGRENLHVNFDPANMILYGAGAPLPALTLLGSFVRSVHCKDATWSGDPGVTWGTETQLGAGAVDFPAFLRTLTKIGYEGPLTIERELPHEPLRQRDEIATAVELLSHLKAGPLSG